MLLLTTKNLDIKDFEEIYFDKLLDKSITEENYNQYLSNINKLSNYRKYCVSNENELCDFKNVPYNPYCDITTKKIEVVFNEEQYVKLLKIDFCSANIPKFRIYGINESEKVSLIADCKYRKANVFGKNKNVILEEIDGKYKKIKIVLLNDNDDLRIDDVNLYY